MHSGFLFILSVLSFKCCIAIERFASNFHNYHSILLIPPQIANHDLENRIPIIDKVFHLRHAMLAW